MSRNPLSGHQNPQNQCLRLKQYASDLGVDWFFKSELHYMYLFMKQHIESTFPGVSCERGDGTILTRPILEKVAGYIKQADLLIKQADLLIAHCTGRNPNGPMPLL